jgi:plasmid stability protein
MVDLLAPAHERGCEAELAEALTAALSANELPDMTALRARSDRAPTVVVSLPTLQSYEVLCDENQMGDAA